MQAPEGRPRSPRSCPLSPYWAAQLPRRAAEKESPPGSVRACQLTGWALGDTPQPQLIRPSEPPYPSGCAAVPVVQPARATPQKRTRPHARISAGLGCRGHPELRYIDRSGPTLAVRHPQDTLLFVTKHRYRDREALYYCIVSFNRRIAESFGEYRFILYLKSDRGLIL
jgi:hypothetical protein